MSTYDVTSCAPPSLCYRERHSLSGQTDHPAIRCHITAPNAATFTAAGLKLAYNTHSNKSMDSSREDEKQQIIGDSFEKHDIGIS